MVFMNIEPISCGYIDPPATQMYMQSKRSYSNVRNQVTEDPDTVVPLLFEKMAALAQNFLPNETNDHPLCLVKRQISKCSQRRSRSSQHIF